MSRYAEYSPETLSLFHSWLRVRKLTEHEGQTIYFAPNGKIRPCTVKKIIVQKLEESLSLELDGEAAGLGDS